MPNPRQRGSYDRLSGFPRRAALLGYLGEHYGLRSAMLVVLAWLFSRLLSRKPSPNPIPKRNGDGE